MTREAQTTPSGRIVENYRAAWTNEDKRVRRRAFSIDKYGEREARRLAIKTRGEGVAAADKARQRRLLDVLHTHRALVGRSADGTGSAGRGAPELLSPSVSARPAPTRTPSA